MNIIDIAIAKQLAGGGGGSGTDSYNDLSNLPKINDVTLSGNKSSSALGLQSEITSDSKLASDLVDDTNQDNKFVTSAEKTTWNGKQNAIDADHKINADYVDDSTSTNKFVTASDKETWNAKQNAIDNSHKLSSDLVDDANHTNKFVTSTEKQTWNAKQNAIDADHKLSSSLVSFSEAEAAAIASGIDSSKVGQISTNQTNILYVANRTGKNYYNIKNENSVFANTDTVTIQSGNKSVTATVNADGSVTLTGATEGTAPTIILEAGDLSRYAGMYLSGAYSDKVFLQMEQMGSPYDLYGKDIGSGAQIVSSIPSKANFFIRIGSNYTIPGSITVKPMICDVDMKNIDPSYQPFSLPNYDLTRLEAEDRAALAEEIDAGAKNLFEMNAANVSRSTETDYSVTESTFQVTASKDWAYTSFIIKGNFDITKTYVLSYRITAESHTSGSTESEIRICPTNLGGNPIINPHITGTGTYTIEFKPTSSTLYLVMYANPSGNSSLTNSFTVTDVMICTKAAFGVSKAFVPYRPNYDLVCESVYKYQDKNFACSESETYEYTGLSVTVPASQVFEISAYNRYGNAPPRGIIIADSNSQSTGAVILGESTGKMSTGDDPKVRSVWCLTSVESAKKTYYIWVKNGNTGSNTVAVAYRRIY